jgi:two-component system LytT family sensor kinase
MGREIAPHLLLPLVENAFKHGVYKQTDNAWLHGDLNISKTGLKLSVENSKPATSDGKSKGGIGLDNLRKRLELLYPSKYLLQIADKGNSYLVNLEIEL